MKTLMQFISEGVVIPFPGKTRQIVADDTQKASNHTPTSSNSHQSMFNHWHDTSILPDDGGSVTVESAYQHCTKHNELHYNDYVDLHSFKRGMRDNGYKCENIAGRARYIGIKLKG